MCNLPTNTKAAQSGGFLFFIKYVDTFYFCAIYLGMKPLKDVFIPSNYADELLVLKDKYFTWKMEFSSKTKIANTGTITHYSVPDSKRGNFVLLPGLASNSEIEPLMRAMTYWSLKHKYNIYAIDTFLGDFKVEKSVELAKRNTFPEFIELMDAGLEIVSRMSMGQWTCVVGHSMGATGALEVFNRRVQNEKPLGVSGAILFAPYASKEWHDSSKRFIRHFQCSELTDEEFARTPMGMGSPHDLAKTNENRYISLFPSFYDDVDSLTPRPDLMAHYDIPVTLVAGGCDRKAPSEFIRTLCEQTNECSPAVKMRFVEFPNSKHSFMRQHEDWPAILNVIKTQYAHKKQK